MRVTLQQRLGSPRAVWLGRGSLAVLLIVLAAVLGVLYRVTADGGHHSYDRGASPAGSYQLTAGGTYRISTRTGVTGLAASGRQADQSSCTIAYGESGSSQLTVSGESSDSRATHVVGSFIAPSTGRATVACDGWGPIFIDDADSSPTDASGFFLLATTVSLVLGVILGLGWLRRTTEARQRRGPTVQG